MHRKVILVIGPSGTGKTRVMHRPFGYAILVTNGSSDLYVAEGIDLEGSTAQVQSVDVVIDGQTVRIIDTPGLDSDEGGKVKGDLIRLFRELYKGQHEIVGIVYMHDISQNRVGKSVVESFEWLFEKCGKAAMRNVVIATNMWWTADDPGRIAEGGGRERELRWGNPCYKPALDQGASLVQHNNTAESALRILRQLMGKEPSS
ncbi:uncharacterized protein B0H18DRAFT_1181273 [Fomitopsis serialis]|uniref:uncharacterized protein n=1 Tax=Fomitopsis serialis TaxID=139415 RepID=UPI002007CFEB|nr:uncharacterized protein B0H18DRAFT_1181273 [Neoantrodia serialis]KAH9934765.1 hypothetical protein B0H18DRAFT_1181273 [Neoantrodia serialis]